MWVSNPKRIFGNGLIDDLANIERNFRAPNILCEMASYLVRNGQQILLRIEKNWGAVQQATSFHRTHCHEDHGKTSFITWTSNKQIKG